MLNRVQLSRRLCRSAKTVSCQGGLSTISPLVFRAPGAFRSLHGEQVNNYLNQPAESIFDSSQSWDKIFEDDTDYAGVPKYAYSPRPAPAPASSSGPRMSLRGYEQHLINKLYEEVQMKQTTQGKQAESGLFERDTVENAIGKLYREHKKQTKRTQEFVHDEKKEAVNRCSTDQALLEWANTRVFAESTRYLDEARKSLQTASTSTGKGRATPPMLQPPDYPKTVALLIKTFRERFHDPHLALAIFQHAKHLSVASYIFGCSTDTYNEVIQTYWSSFQDVQAARDTLQEMITNRVAIDGFTMKLVEQIRQKLARDLNTDDLEHQRLWSFVTEMEVMVGGTQPLTSQGSAPRKNWDSWKHKLATAKEEDDGFDDWEQIELDNEKRQAERGERLARRAEKERYLC